MANKREFKKYVEALGASACDSMMSAYYDIKDADKEKIEQAITKVLGAIGAARANADIPFNQKMKSFDNIQAYLKAKKDYYRNLFEKNTKDFHDEINAALKEFNEAVPQAVKNSNKTAVSQ